MPFAEVYPLVSARAIARPFTYEVPDGVEKGAVVGVRFGRSRRRGVVVEVGGEPPEGVEAVPVERVLESLPPALVDLALWIADYYGSTPARALELVAPYRPARRKEQSPPAERLALAGEKRPTTLRRAGRRIFCCTA
jgi:primosomal protein N'